MKIIKEGILSSERKWQGTCHNCKSIIEATEGEISIGHSDQRDGPTGNADCPKCHVKMFFYPLFNNSDRE